MKYILITASRGMFTREELCSRFLSSQTVGPFDEHNKLKCSSQSTLRSALKLATSKLVEKSNVSDRFKDPKQLKARLLVNQPVYLFA